jgi:hypothetical protein
VGWDFPGEAYELVGFGSSEPQEFEGYGKQDIRNSNLHIQVQWVFLEKLSEHGAFRDG